MLNHFQRTLKVATCLALVLWTPSAFAAPGRRPTPHKPGAVVHRARTHSFAVAASVLLGDTSVEWQYDQLPGGRAEAFRLRAGASGRADAVHVYISAYNAAGTLIAGLYSSTAGHPGTLLSTGSTSTSEPGTWTAVPIVPVVLTAGRFYWLALLGEGGRLRYRDRPSGSCQSKTSARRHLHALPGYWRTGATYSDCPVSAYLTPAATDGALLSASLTEGTALLAEPAGTSTPAPSAPAAAAPVATAPPTISGEEIVGHRLSASSGSWSGGPTSFKYQWQRCGRSGSGCTDIAGASASSYVLAGSDVGNTLRVMVMAYNAVGSAEQTSPTTTVVEVQAPSNTRAPQISGVAEEGQTLTTSTGSWEGTTPLTYSYQWEDCDQLGEGCTPIAGAEGSAYQLTSSDVGNTVTVLVTAANSAGEATAMAALTGAVAGPPPSEKPSSEAPPKITGTAEVGDTLTVSNGTWTGEPTRFAYEWEDCNQAKQACTPIAGASADSYTPTDADVGDTVSALVTAYNEAGSGSARAPASEPVTTTAYRTFYVNYGAGNEANSGTSETSAWKLAPGMRGFKGAYAHKPGDRFIFEGGVTWPNAALPLIAVGSGESGNDDYYGVNDTWYSGAKYAAPIFNAEGKHTVGNDPLSGLPLDDMMWLNQRDYITVEGIHFENWTATKLPSGYECNGISLNNGGDSGDTHIALNRIAFTGWSADYESVEANEDNCRAIDSSGAPTDSSLTNSTVEGKEGEAYGWSVFCLSRVEHDVIGKAIDLLTPCPSIAEGKVAIVAGNTLFDCGYPKWPAGAAENQHGDAIQSSDGPPSTGETDYIYDNVIYNTGYTGEGVYEGKQGHEGECESSLLGGEVGTHLVTDYLWNNVYYDIHGNSPSSDGSSEYFYAWNNTIEAGETGREACLHTSHGGVLVELVWQNNICFSSAGATAEGVSGTAEASAEKIDHNLLLTPEEAKVKAKGYRTPKEVEEAKTIYAYSPLSESAAGVGKGEDLQSLCSGSLASLCGDTTYAGARTPLKRPTSGAWDIGAYQW